MISKAKFNTVVGSIGAAIGIFVFVAAADYLRLARSGRYVATDAAHAELLYVRNKIALTAQEQAQQKAKP